MHSKLDLLDVKILEGLGIYGPRNIAKAARKLGIPRGTMLSRTKRMSSLFYLRFIASVYHTNLGLKKAVVFAEATPGYEELLFNCMKVNDFYVYVSQCYGMFEGCIGIYTIPNRKSDEFERFIQEIEKLGIARKAEVNWSTCFHTVNRTSNWFDPQSETWIFPWDKWTKEVLTEGTTLPYTLLDPEDFPVKADEIDLFIIKELEKDATVSFAELAKMLDISPQLIRYHFYEHLIKRNLIEGFQIFIFPFNRLMSDMFYFKFIFEGREKMAKFALSLLNKPFVNAMGKILGGNTILANIYLSRVEFRRFVQSLSKLIRSGFLQSYDYIIQDIRNVPKTWSRETIPFEFFKDGSWIYNHDKHIKNLHDLVMRSMPKTTTPQYI